MNDALTSAGCAVNWARTSIDAGWIRSKISHTRTFLGHDHGSCVANRSPVLREDDHCHGLHFHPQTATFAGCAWGAIVLFQDDLVEIGFRNYGLLAVLPIFPHPYKS